MLNYNTDCCCCLWRRSNFDFDWNIFYRLLRQNIIISSIVFQQQKLIYFWVLFMFACCCCCCCYCWRRNLSIRRVIEKLISFTFTSFAIFFALDIFLTASHTMSSGVITNFFIFLLYHPVFLIVIFCFVLGLLVFLLDY